MKFLHSHGSRLFKNFSACLRPGQTYQQTNRQKVRAMRRIPLEGDLYFFGIKICLREREQPERMWPLTVLCCRRHTADVKELHSTILSGWSCGTLTLVRVRLVNTVRIEQKTSQYRRSVPLQPKPATPEDACSMCFQTQYRRPRFQIDEHGQSQ